MKALFLERDLLAFNLKQLKAFKVYYGQFYKIKLSMLTTRCRLHLVTPCCETTIHLDPVQERNRHSSRLCHQYECHLN